MKKFLSGLIAAFLLSAGFVAVSAETASAACSPSRYVECNVTSTKVTPAPKVIKQGKAAKVKVVVNTRGNVKAKGDVTVKVTGPGGFKKTLKAAYNGKAVTLNVGKLKKPGRYKVQVSFDGDTGFKDSKGTSTITVKKKK